eukprot:747391-Hanusia_phi.AAC.1
MAGWQKSLTVRAVRGAGRSSCHRLEAEGLEDPRDERPPLAGEEREEGRRGAAVDLLGASGRREL